ncbi:hypothetical protein K469DRAFT_47874 [Zopfia rhizophila CBS 207.26]|uniref:Uncharacterized protein n=1 Tax=Zopfia rhizophila CBS 207.26 TaxID=1314779 RepID=A0A6A6ECQ4_9PEZI|nr:hypothetical protein K469DRAFT_47874 [Zopfia rhizophila CBS 207.26]
MMENKVWIILAAVLGVLVLTLVLTLALFCWKRSKRIRGFSLRAVTPLDDAEFESWRRPSQYTKRPEKYGIRPTQPAVVRTRTPNIFEKELGVYNQPQTPPRSPTQTAGSSSSPIRMPEKARRKSSVSIADRPPTPYSPASMSGEFPRRGSRASHRSSHRSQGSPRHIYYPSMSECSEFNFEFNFDFDPLQQTHGRQSNQSERRLYYPNERYSDIV